MAALLALVAAICFALAATLQQRGQFRLAGEGVSVSSLSGLLRLIAVPVWLLGCVVLLLGYGAQGIALDIGRIVVVQPLMVTTIVWALPLGYWLTNQNVVPRQILGAGVVVVGLALFVLVGDPDAGVDEASTVGLLMASAFIVAAVLGMLVWMRLAEPTPSLRAAALGVASGLLFGLSAIFAKPVIHDLHISIWAAAGDWRTWALLLAGFAGFVIQQMSLATGQLAPAMAAVSVSNPAVSVILGILLYDEQLTPPPWHIVVAFAALAGALGGALLITLANRETEMPGAAKRPVTAATT